MDGETGMDVDRLDEELKQAGEMLDAGDFEAAVEALEAAAEKYPDSPLPLHNLGAVYMLYLQADTNSPVLWEDLTDDEEAYIEATNAFTQAIEIDPGFVPSLNNLAALEAMREEYMAAVELWERSLEVNPGQTEIIEDLEAVRKRLELGNEEL